MENHMNLSQSYNHRCHQINVCIIESFWKNRYITSIKSETCRKQAFSCRLLVQHAIYVDPIQIDLLFEYYIMATSFHIQSETMDVSEKKNKKKSIVVGVKGCVGVLQAIEWL